VSSAPKKSPAAKSPAADSAASTTANGSSASSYPGPVPRSRYLAYFAIAIVGCGADLFTKQAMLAWLGLPAQLVDPANPNNFARWRGDAALPHRWWLIDERLGIETSINRGALFGMGEGYWWVFACLSIAATVAILTWLFIFRAAHDRWLTVALGSITGGILGNLYDRLGLWDSTGLRPEFQHGVRDWILFKWSELGLQLFNPWPNFNIADSLLVTGAIMLVVHALVWRDKPEAAMNKTEVTGQETGDKTRGTAIKRPPAKASRSKPSAA
jgi:signal peptidase II